VGSRLSVTKLNTKFYKEHARKLKVKDGNMRHHVCDPQCCSTVLISTNVKTHHSSDSTRTLQRPPRRPASCTGSHVTVSSSQRSYKKMNENKDKPQLHRTKHRRQQDMHAQTLPRLQINNVATTNIIIMNNSSKQATTISLYARFSATAQRIRQRPSP
jgi:hypothetical protein